MTVMFLVVCLTVAIAIERLIVDLPFYLVTLLDPSPWVVWGGLLLLLGWCLGK